MVLSAVDSDQRCSICGDPGIVSCAPFDVSTHRVIHCRACGHEVVRPLPTPDELRAFYSDYPTTQTSEADLRFLFERSREFLDEFLDKTGLRETPKSELNYLEIGFGNGASLFAAAAAGLRTLGIDLDESGVARTRANALAYGVSVECSATDIHDFRRDLPLNLVKASQVIEHTLDPEQFLRDIAGRQPIGGHLILEFPNNAAAFWLAKNMLRKRYGRMNYYKSLKIGEHLSGFTRKSIGILLHRVGYGILRCHDYPLRHRVLQPENLIWYPSFADGVRRTLGDRNPYHFLKSLIPLFDRVASSLFGLGTHLSVWAQKQSQH